MLKKAFLLAALILLSVAPFPKTAARSSAQDVLAEFKGNNCVKCHSQVMNPLRLTSRYGEWHMSLHREKAVGCEKCHGGDPAIADAKQAHKDVLLAKEATSRLNPKNLPETCKSCHQNIVSSFVESNHYQNLQKVGLGPTCNTCHAHMASEVIYTGEQTATLCSTCHNSTNPLLPKRPEIPVRAGETVEAIRRANTVIAWADRLLEEAERRKLDIADAQKEMKIVKAMQAEAKISWHAFNLDVVRKKADTAFEAGTALKDSLRSKLYKQ